MSKTLTYAQRTHDSRNPIKRFAHRSRYAASLSFTDKLLPRGGSIVDFGAGQGYFLSRLHDVRPDARLIAVEPYMEIASPVIERVAAMDDLAHRSIDLVTAFETLEHVEDDHLATFLAASDAVLTGQGRLLVTVPIMYGATLILKEASRAAIYRHWGDTSATELLRGTFGRPIARTTERRFSHKGFDFRELRKQIAERFTITEIAYSPFPALPWWLNSQAIFVAVRKPALSAAALDENKVDP
ncbi:class I SAM-dependent methyltransferase [Sphingomonas alpina]|uniref:Methyltransferase domain-containing protein n=1 Tax=Sphingomonas alpina TaxID=653931 RepID=A0A7H0LE47_9SPHN|nr:methyltransferase domain-containing protein [Sphingomonas alpina]QNQ07950.1 methyltransferase domain-containing protein [Sphingomonas alpina]